jgi:hypothetical protein
LINQSGFAHSPRDAVAAATDFPFDGAKTIVDAIGKFVIAECDHQHSE